MQTRLWTEANKVLARLNPASYNSEQNTTRVDVGKYNRVTILYLIGAMATNAVLNSDIEQHTAASGGSSKNVDGKSITQMTEAGSDSNKIVAVEIAAEELDVDGGYHYLSVEVTPTVAATILGVLVIGHDARYEPVGTTEFDEVVN